MCHESEALLGLVVPRAPNFLTRGACQPSHSLEQPLPCGPPSPFPPWIFPMGPKPGVGALPMSIPIMCMLWRKQAGCGEGSQMDPPCLRASASPRGSCVLPLSDMGWYRKQLFSNWEKVGDGPLQLLMAPFNCPLAMPLPWMICSCAAQVWGRSFY